MARNGRRSDCPIHCALNVPGDRWALVIVRDLLFSSRATFSQLLNSPEKAATNTLAIRPASLEAAGIVEQLPGDKRYLLTEKGLDLTPVLIELVLWSSGHDQTVADLAADLEPYLDQPQQFIEQIKTAARQRRLNVCVFDHPAALILILPL